MSVTEYKESIKNLIDSTTNESLLKRWKQQLEWDIQHEELNLTPEEWALVQEGITDFETGNTITLDQFISKRR